jgi:hypothetical protein
METEPTENRSDLERIAVYLTPDEALVLDAFLNRGEAAGDNYGTIEDQAELRVLWDLAAILESWLVAPLEAEYPERLARARDAVRDATD